MVILQRLDLSLALGLQGEGYLVDCHSLLVVDLLPLFSEVSDCGLELQDDVPALILVPLGLLLYEVEFVGVEGFLGVEH